MRALIQLVLANICAEYINYLAFRSVYGPIGQRDEIVIIMYFPFFLVSLYPCLHIVAQNSFNIDSSHAVTPLNFCDALQGHSNNDKGQNHMLILSMTQLRGLLYDMH